MKKFFAVFVFFFSFFIVQDVSAMEIMRKEGTVFGATTIESNRVQTMLPGGKTKFVRHVKYVDSTQKNQESYTQTSGNFTRFSYRCPGFYMTRTYSDYKGTKQTGTIRIYVAPGDIPNAPSHCAEVTPPPNNAPAAPPADVVKINTTHPNPLAIEPGNMINADYDFPDGVNSGIWGQIADPGEPEYVAEFPEIIPDQPYTHTYPFEQGGYNPLDNFHTYYPLPGNVSSNQNWMNNVDFDDETTFPVGLSAGQMDGGMLKMPEIADKDLEGDACLDADANIYYYESYYDDYKDANEDNTLCISREEYANCDLVRYFATYRDGWDEYEDQNFANVSQDLKDLLSFPSIYCKHLTNYIEPSYPYDPVTEANLSRAAYQVNECADDSDACHDLLPDPYYTPTSAPVDPGNSGGGSTNPDGGGGSPRRGYAELLL